MGIFSFAGNKVLTCGEGGAVVTNSKKLSDRLKLIRSHGRLTNNNYFRTNEKPTYIQLGYNWRMSSITAALASSQLTKIEKLIKMRRSNAKYMTKQLDKYDEIYVLKEGKEQRHVFQLFSILLSTNKLRSKLFNFLTKKQIMTKIFFEPIHKSKFYKNSRNLKLINTNDISSRIISLPMYPQLTKNEMNYICNSIKEFLERESCY
jgi:perosamine synthetase